MLFIAEGSNDVGKSTLVRRLETRLTEAGHDCVRMAFPGNEPGSLGKLVYDIHHDPAAHGVADIDPAALQIMHIAAHVDAIARRIRPLLEQGTIVLLDRFWWSTLIYGRVSGVDEDVLQAMIEVERKFWGDTQPDMAFLIDRHAPIESDMDLGIWERLRTDYLQFAEEQKSVHPVTVIENDSSVEAAVDTMMDALSPIL